MMEEVEGKGYIIKREGWDIIRESLVVDLKASRKEKGRKGRISIWKWEGELFDGTSTNCFINYFLIIRLSTIAAAKRYHHTTVMGNPPVNWYVYTTTKGYFPRNSSFPSPFYRLFTSAKNTTFLEKAFKDCTTICDEQIRLLTWEPGKGEYHASPSPIKFTSKEMKRQQYQSLCSFCLSHTFDPLSMKVILQATCKP